jgi:hypothetical protein
MNYGRIDDGNVNRYHIYIFEFKMGQSAKIAIVQINKKEYSTPYLSNGKPITLIGINTSKRKRNNVASTKNHRPFSGFRWIWDVQQHSSK